jgi:GNAT superfamily N-acetyltransferase
MVDIVQATTPEQIDVVRGLMREYTTWAASLDPASDEAPTFWLLEEELATLPGIYAPPAGRLFLATVDGAPAGHIALRPHDAATGEVKRLYVQPAFRGLAIGQRLVAAVVEAARTIGYRRLVLDSYHTMTNAHVIYRGAGFRDVDAPADFPRHLVPVVVFMEMTLDPHV